MGEPLDEKYFKWLCKQVRRPGNLSYWRLLRQMYQKEFVWLLPNDIDRASDGAELRYEFIDDLKLTDVPIHWMELGASFLEVLIALSRRLSFETDDLVGIWFWILVNNMGLRYANDRSNASVDEIDDFIDTVIWRTYAPSGRGGLFPLLRSTEDQRKVEIWYQMSAYILELETF